MDNNNQTTKPWYKKKRYIIPIAAFGLIYIIGASNSPSAQSTIEPISVFETQSNNLKTETASTPSTPTVKSVAPTVSSSPETTKDDSATLSNDNYYVNVDGNTVHSPAYSNSIPAGASAKCRDGTYSFSQNRRGTCSHHGGVAEWY